MKIIDIQHSSDGASDKILWEVAPGISVESVSFLFNGEPSICISSQAGCNVGCAFCETGKQKNQKNLTPEEIYNQVALSMIELNIDKYKTVLFAGMGEPLNNFYHVAKSVNLLLDSDITEEVSITTSGIVPYMHKLCDVPISRLGISIHATTDEARNLLVPINKKYPLKEVIAAGENFFVKTGKPVTVNYLLFENVNDTDDDIERLAHLLSPAVFKIKLKHWNDVNVEWLKKSSSTVFDKFVTVLSDRGFCVSTCISEGADIGAGCGQLHSANRILRKSRDAAY